MRLIDADNLSRSCCNSKICSNCDDMYKGENVRVNCSEVRYYYLQMINGAPTVEAIPVEWIEEWYEKALKNANDGDDIAVDRMLDDWRRRK